MREVDEVGVGHEPLFEGKYNEIVILATASSGAKPTLILVRSSANDLNAKVSDEAVVKFGVITSFSVLSGSTRNWSLSFPARCHWYAARASSIFA
jgi:hypothetical protein